jgi:hypothetical protein
MKILESTERRLVIEFENFIYELTCLALWVSTLVTLCFFAILENLPSFISDSLRLSFARILSFAMGWLLIHLLFPGNRRNADYWLTVISGSIPILGVGISSFLALSLLQFPQTAFLTFDKDENLLIVKKNKILFWHPVTQYPLDEIIEFTRTTKTVYTSANPVLPISVVQLARRRQNGGRILHKDIVGGTDANQSLVDQINRFLLHI